jgi:hypothetical protein
MDYKGQHFDLTKRVGTIMAGIRIVCDSVAGEMEEYAQANAGWTDRTGNARRMLKGYVAHDDGALVVGIAHRAKDERTGEIYGKYLEGWDKDTHTLTHKGKYPILKETLDEFEGEFFNRIQNVIRNGGSPD